MQSKLKICFVGHECGYYKGQGGIATYIELTAKGFRKLGFEVHVIFFHGTEIDEPGILSWKIKDKNDNLKNSKAVDDLLEKIKPNYVESADFLGLISYTLSKRAISKLSYDCIFVNNHHTGIREVWEWGTYLDFIQCAPAWMKVIYISERTQSLLADANYSTSNFLADYLGKMHCENYCACPSYYQVSDDYKVKNKLGRENNKLRILSFGRFESRKKQELLIKASCNLLNQGVNIEITLIGNSGVDFYTQQDYMEYCYGIIPPNYKDKFHFYDFIPYKRLQYSYTDFDLFVIPSPYENFPNTALEAINYGVFVIGSKTSGIADINKNLLSVYNFEKNSIHDIERVIKNYSVLSEKQRCELRKEQRCSLTNLTNFENSIQRRFDSYSKIYKRIPKVVCLETDNILVYQNEKEQPSKFYYDGKFYDIRNPEWRNIICTAKYITLLAKDNRFDENNIFYPPVRVASCFSFSPPYGTMKEILASEKAFSKMTLSLEDIEISSEWNLLSLIANILIKCNDVIFFMDKEKENECGLGKYIKYEIDLYNHLYCGDKCS
ncbi:glycosyltransferase family 4 protein [Xenorhabdus sp. KJ12.1]|uniref:glycosyltransferase family 4 protein n=1 Tax=Xenorhabdus sp. KJ12.1 TaxID=1851571 RepID=UPI000C0413CD|nr:glycosyltransferase family 4 protein [Xenorhabdus sp. KJ12.1]PHM66412.1 glycosyltransferase [Xenorhabdus sp. KJ12.1]